MKRYFVLPLMVFFGVAGYGLWMWTASVMALPGGLGDNLVFYILGIAFFCVIGVPVAWIAGPVVALASIVVVGLYNLTSTLIRRFRA